MKLDVYEGKLTCRYRQCQHSRQSGRRRYVVSSSPDDARAQLAREFSEARLRRCGDCRRVIAIAGLSVTSIEETD